MEHLLLKAATTVATDQGEFEAVISTATIDRERDIVDPEGFVRALQKWVPTGKRIPLAWNHSSRAEDQIGYIDPSTARVANGEVLARGWIDQATAVGKDAWRMVKMGTLGFSFGYLVPQGGSSPRKGGGRHIRELDVFEVTATNAPMNGDTRVVGWKATVAPDGTMLDNADDDDATETPLKAIADAIEELQEFVAGEQVEGDSADVQQAERLITNLQALMRTEMGQGDDGKTIDVRAEAAKLSRELARKDATPKADVELEALRAAHEQQATQLKTIQDELADAKRQLEARSEDSDTLRRAGEALTLDAVRNTRRRGRKAKDEPSGAEWVVPAGELEGAKSGALKAVWTTAYVNDLPDSSFLMVEDGGDKDSEGKTTPRSLRHFPYKDASGAVDLPHLRNALARIPQSSLPQDVKDRLTSRAQSILDNQKSLTFDADVTVDVTGRGPDGFRSVDPLVQEARALATRYRAGGITASKPPREEKATRPELNELELRREMRDLMLTALKGST